MPSASTAPLFLFGNTKPWLPPPWTTTDDRIRGGSSQSHLSSLASNSALFHGTLDIKTLGGAGFASQFSPADAPPNKSGTDEGSHHWDLSAYDGIEIAVGEGDGKTYTLILKDEPLPGKREDGREKAGVSWEVDMEAGEEGGRFFWVPWSGFKATYRGKEKGDAGELKIGRVCRVGVMMRSYFGTQKGDFRLELKSISARKRTDDDAERSRTRSGKVEVNSTADVNEKSKPESEGGGSMEALKDWLSALNFKTILALLWIPIFSSDLLGCDDHGPSHPQVRLAGYYPHPPTPPTSSSPPLPLRKHSYPLPMLKPRNITPPEDKLTQVMKPPSSVEATQPQYERTLVAVKKLEEERPEGPVSLTLSCRAFYRLMEDLGYDQSDQIWPKYSYNASTSCLVVQCMPSPIHQSIITTFAEAFWATRHSLPRRYRNNLVPVTGENFNRFEGRYSGSDKIADLAVQTRNNAGQLGPKFVLEVGFSESYDLLLQSAKLWIEGTSTVSIVVIVGLVEAPKYRCPISSLSDEAFDALRLPLTIEDSMFELPLHRYGPATYRGLHWTGEILRAEVEVWKKDALTGDAYRDGQRMDVLSSDPPLTFTLSDFMTLPPDQHDHVIDFDWDNCRNLLREKLQGLAAYRYMKMMKSRGKLEHGGDRDYEP